MYRFYHLYVFVVISLALSLVKIGSLLSVDCESIVHKFFVTFCILYFAFCLLADRGITMEILRLSDRICHVKDNNKGP